MKASVFVGTSLDGFIARADGSFETLPADGGEPHGYDEFFATVDALVIGRNTFEVVAKFPSWPYGEKPVFVLSTRTLPPAPDGAVVKQWPGRRPKSFPGFPLGESGIFTWMAGGQPFNAFFGPGSSSASPITRVPVLIGSGIPLLARRRTISS